MMRRHSELALLLIASAVLLTAWSLVVPMFEGPDEPAHWQYIVHLHDERRLPVYAPGFEEANSPPLYYALMAPFAFSAEGPKSLDSVDAAGVVHVAPGVWRFDASAADLSRYPAPRLVRLLTALLSVGTVWLVYRSGHEAGGSAATGLLAGGLTILLPQFTFRAMNISNDAMVTLTSALATYLIVRLLCRTFTWRDNVAAAIAVALAFLSKTTALFLPLALALAIMSTSDDWPTRARRLAVLLLSLAIVAPWLVRNYVLYGDILASRPMLAAVAHIVDPKPLLSPYFLDTFPKLFVASFVGLFGWMSIRLPRWIYVGFIGLGTVSAAGLIAGAWRRRIPARVLITLGAIVLLNFAVVVRINLTFTQPQGRYLFPALPAFMVLAALGFSSVRWWSRRVTYVLLAALLAVNLYSLIAIVSRAAR